MQSSLKTTFSERLKTRLEETGIRQTELCDMIGIGKSAMSQYLHGAFVPKQKKLSAIAEALDVSEGWLMGYDVAKCRAVSAIGEQRTEAATEEYFEMIAYDDSMDGVHIPKGAKVTLKKALTFAEVCGDDEVYDALDGKIVGITINKGRTLIRFLHKNGERLMITAANPEYPPYVFDASEVEVGTVEILGVVELVEIKF